MDFDSQQNTTTALNTEVLFTKAIANYIGFGGQNPDYEKAFQIFKNIYEKTNSPEAAYWLAKCYQFGNGVKKDFTTANKLFMVAANSKSQDVRGISQFYISQNYRLLRGVSAANDPNINNLMANMYLIKAAKNGVPQAQYEVGARYLFGLSVPQDTQRGIRYLYAAANPTGTKVDETTLNINGYGKAQELLAWCYRKGVGVANIDTTKALAYMQSATLKDVYAASAQLNENKSDLDITSQAYKFDISVISKKEEHENKPEFY